MISAADVVSDETFNYIVMILIYSGVGSWLIGRLTRSREDERRAERARVSETLSLLDSVTRTRDSLTASNAPAERVAPYDVMRDRLSREAREAVAELNLLAHQEHAQPSSRFVLIPTPLGVFGVVLTLIFCAALYFAFMMWLTLAFYIWMRPEFDLISDPASRTTGYFLLVGGLTLFAVSMAARSWAYERYDTRHKRQRARAEKELAPVAAAVSAAAAEPTAAPAAPKTEWTTAAAQASPPEASPPEASPPEASPPEAPTAEDASTPSPTAPAPSSTS